MLSKSKVKKLVSKYIESEDLVPVRRYPAQDDSLRSIIVTFECYTNPELYAEFLERIDKIKSFHIYTDTKYTIISLMLKDSNKLTDKFMKKFDYDILHHAMFYKPSAVIYKHLIVELDAIPGIHKYSSVISPICDNTKKNKCKKSEKATKVEDEDNESSHDPTEESKKEVLRSDKVNTLSDTNQHNKEMLKMKKKYGEKINKLEQEIKEIKNKHYVEMGELADEFNDIQGVKIERGEKIIQLEKEIKEIKKIGKLENVINGIKKQDEDIGKMKDDIKEIKKKHDKQVIKIKIQHVEEISGLKKDIDNIKELLYFQIHKHDKEITKIKVKYSEEINILKKESHASSVNLSAQLIPQQIDELVSNDSGCPINNMPTNKDISATLPQ